MNEYFKRDYQHIKVRINETDNIINKYKEDGYRLLSTSQSEPEYLHLYFEKYVSIDELEDYEQSTQDKIIRATRKSNVTNEILLDTFAEKGLVGIYNLGLKNMFDYLRNDFLKSTGIDLNEMYLVTIIKAELYLGNPFEVREITIYTLPQINENKGKIEDYLYRLAYSIRYKEIDNYKIIEYPNYKMLTLTYESSDDVSNSTIQEIYEFVKK